MMIDIHTHILAGIDDGPSDIDDSRLMLQYLAGQKVSCIGLTPHYYHTEQPLEDFLAGRDSAVNDIKPFADELGILLLPGSETYLTDDLLNERDLKPLCFYVSLCVQNEPIWQYVDF
jgi:protein-tyrosine phosphatase